MSNFHLVNAQKSSAIRTTRTADQTNSFRREQTAFYQTRAQAARLPEDSWCSGIRGPRRLLLAGSPELRIG